MIERRDHNTFAAFPVLICLLACALFSPFLSSLLVFRFPLVALLDCCLSFIDACTELHSVASLFIQQLLFCVLFVAPCCQFPSQLLLAPNTFKVGVSQSPLHSPPCMLPLMLLPRPPYPELTLLIRMLLFSQPSSVFIHGVISSCAAYKQQYMREAADDAEADEKCSSQQASQQLEELDNDEENDGGDEESDSQGRRRRKRKRKAAGPKQHCSITIRYESTHDVFNQQSGQYEQCADGGNSDEQQQQHAELIDGMDQLSLRMQQPQPALLRQRQPHMLRFPFPKSGAAHCSQCKNDSAKGSCTVSLRSVDSMHVVCLLASAVCVLSQCHLHTVAGVLNTDSAASTEPALVILRASRAGQQPARY